VDTTVGVDICSMLSSLRPIVNTYWKRRGWKLREDIDRYSLIMGEDENA
jgi:hypothetical protein